MTTYTNRPEANEPYAEGPAEYRVDFTDDMRTWAANARRFNDPGEAESYAIAKSWVWTTLKAWRVVPTTVPEREPVDIQASADAGYTVRDLT